jgi:cytosine/adenosine deaminase-related metal-dependent hydrolase
MSTNPSRTDPSSGGRPGAPKPADTSRRDFIKAGAAGLAGTTIAAGLVGTSIAEGQVPAGLRSATPRDVQNLVGDGRRRRILLRGGTVLSLDPRVGDFEKADVLIDGKTIAQIAPNIAAGNAEVVDCTGTIVMPGFVTTHNHQYESLQRAIIPDGLLGLPWPAESYGSVVQSIWTVGRLAEPGPAAGVPGKVIWDLGRVPYDPEDLYTAELIANLGQISEGITCGTDTGQANHTPAHTDAMIKGHIDSGRRMLFDYTAGTNRSAEGAPFEYPGAMNDSTKGIGRIAKTYFSSKDQLVTLGFGGGGGPAFPGADYTGWQLARSFGAFINNHSVGNPQGIVNSANDPRNGKDWSDVTFVHATRWQDNSVAQIGQNAAYPNSHASRAWEIVRDRGAHVSIAVLIEAQMRHGMPPMQAALNYGILPSLSPDVDTNMTTDPFSLMRGAFCIQRGLANDLAFKESNPGNLPIPQLLTSRQCIEMATIAGAAGSGLLNKVGTLTPGKEADIVVLEARSINTWPMNNVPGTIVTMMNPRHVRDVLIAGKVVYWKGKLVGWNVDQLLRRVEQARDRVLARINGPAKVGKLPQYNNSFSNPYRPNLMASCCYKGQNKTSAEYVLRP